MSDKYLPNLTEATSIAYSDLIYIVGSVSGDYRVTLQNARLSMNPTYASVIKASDYVVLVGDCVGKWFSNKTASGTVAFELPLASSGLSVGFVVESSNFLRITPQAGDKIASLGVDGQSIQSNTLRNAILLRATNSDWYVVSKTGTWSAV